MAFIESWGKVVFAVSEGSWGAVGTPVADDAVQVLEVEINGDRRKEWRDDSQQTRSRKTRIPGRIEADYRARGYLIPYGAVGVQPDNHAMLYALLGNYATSSTMVEYRPKDKLRRGFTLWREVDDEASLWHMEGAIGCIGARGEFRFGRGAYPEYEFSGPAKYLTHAIDTLLFTTLIAPAGTTTYKIPIYSPHRVMKSAVIQFVHATSTFNNGGLGYLASSVQVNVADPHYLFIKPGIKSKTWNKTTKVLPFKPAVTVHGDPVDSSLGSVTIDNVPMDFIGGTITVDEKREVVNDEYGYDQASDVQNADLRDVTFDLEAYIKDEAVLQFMGRSLRNVATVPLTINIGTTAGQRIRIHMPAADMDRPSVDLPNAAPGRIRMTGVAKATTREDEIYIRFH